MEVAKWLCVNVKIIKSVWVINEIMKHIHMHGFYNLFQVFALAFKATQRSNVSSANLTYYYCNMNLTEVLHFYFISHSVKYWILTAENRVQSRITSCDIHGIGSAFSPIFLCFLPLIVILSSLHTNLSLPPEVYTLSHSWSLNWRLHFLPCCYHQDCPEDGGSIFPRNTSRVYTFTKPQVMTSQKTNINTHRIETMKSHTSIIVLTKAPEKLGLQSLPRFPISTSCISLWLNSWVMCLISRRD